MKSIRIGTRGSTLALAQTAWVEKKLKEKYPDALIETILIKTSGDRFFEASVQAIGGKGIFTKEIEDALLTTRDRYCRSLHERFAYRVARRIDRGGDSSKGGSA